MMNTKKKRFTTRFAPSPTGLLHKGHAFAALTAYQRAQYECGRFLLRVEDIDTTRCKPAFIQAIYEDLAWLGIKWEQPVRIQSEHFDDYMHALTQLKLRGLAYPCFCTRKEIQAEIEQAPSAPHGFDGPIYPGTCKNLTNVQIKDRMDKGTPYAWRLNLALALENIKTPLTWIDEIHGTITAKPETLGDIILARKDTPTSYHLSVVVDDALQGITHVVRGEDLLPATHIHIVLQKLLDLPPPTYHHHPLMLDSEGKRLAKRDKAITLRQIRETGVSAEALRKSIGL